MHLEVRVTRTALCCIVAVCVNEMDSVERSQQVQLMGSLYDSVTRVIVFVGAEADKSSSAIELLERIGTNVEVN